MLMEGGVIKRDFRKRDEEELADAASTAPIVPMTRIERAVDRGDLDVLRIYKNKARLVAGLLALRGAVGRMSGSSGVCCDSYVRGGESLRRLARPPRGDYA